MCQIQTPGVYVEEKVRQLCATMQQHLTMAEVPAQKLSIEEEAKKRQADAKLLKAQQDREAARGAVAAFYLEHNDLLQAVYPPAILRTTLLAFIPDSCSSQKAWEGARQLIVELQTLKLQEEARQRQEAKRPRRLTNPDDV